MDSSPLALICYRLPKSFVWPSNFTNAMLEDVHVAYIVLCRWFNVICVCVIHAYGSSLVLLKIDAIISIEGGREVVCFVCLCV